jgi:hypothetical protein
MPAMTKDDQCRLGMVGGGGSGEDEDAGTDRDANAQGRPSQGRQ